MTQPISTLLRNRSQSYVFVTHDQTVDECIALMKGKGIGAIVVKEQSAIIGLISERDIVRKAAAEGLDTSKTKAEAIAYKNVSILDANDSIEQAMAVITATKRRHVLIQINGQIKHIVSIGDVMNHLLDEKGFIIEQLQNYITS